MSDKYTEKAKQKSIRAIYESKKPKKGIGSAALEGAKPGAIVGGLAGLALGKKKGIRRGAAAGGLYGVVKHLISKKKRKETDFVAQLPKKERMEYLKSKEIQKDLEKNSSVFTNAFFEEVSENLVKIAKEKSLLQEADELPASREIAGAGAGALAGRYVNKKRTRNAADDFVKKVLKEKDKPSRAGKYDAYKALNKLRKRTSKGSGKAMLIGSVLGGLAGNLSRKKKDEKDPKKARTVPEEYKAKEERYDY